MMGTDLSRSYSKLGLVVRMFGGLLFGLCVGGGLAFCALYLSFGGDVALRTEEDLGRLVLLVYGILFGAAIGAMLGMVLVFLLRRVAWAG